MACWRESCLGWNDTIFQFEGHRILARNGHDELLNVGEVRLNTTGQAPAMAAVKIAGTAVGTADLRNGFAVRFSARLFLQKLIFRLLTGYIRYNLRKHWRFFTFLKRNRSLL